MSLYLKQSSKPNINGYKVMVKHRIKFNIDTGKITDSKWHWTVDKLKPIDYFYYEHTKGCGMIIIHLN